MPRYSKKRHFRPFSTIKSTTGDLKNFEQSWKSSRSKFLRYPVSGPNLVNLVIMKFWKFESSKSSLIALVGDFFIDVYFLQGLSTDTLIDVKYIHFEYGALLTMVCFEFSAFLCLPITAFVFYKVKLAENLQKKIRLFRWAGATIFKRI